MRPKVCIIGAGVAGVAAAQNLWGFADVTLISTKDYYEIPWPRVRLPVEPSFGKRITIPLKARDALLAHTKGNPDEDVPKSGTNVITSKAKSVTDQSVELENGQSIEYDYLILATGMQHAAEEFGPKTSSITERYKQHLPLGLHHVNTCDMEMLQTEITMRVGKVLQTYEKELSAASDVLIVGGGPTGCELAGEIASVHPSKHVTLVHSGNALLQELPPKMGKLLKEKLEKMGVKIFLNERAEQSGDVWKLQKAGTSLMAQKVYLCYGGTPHTEFLKASLPAVLTDRGYVKVDSSLQVEGHPNWFAIGDITSLPDDRLGRIAQDQGVLVAANLKAKFASNDKKQKLWKKNGGMEVLVVTLGKNQAVMTAFGWTFSGWLPVWLKSKDLLTSMTRSKMGLPK